MKKFLALFIIISFISSNSCFAFSELYYIKNAKASDIATIVEYSYNSNGYKLSKQNPYYGLAPSGDDYAIVILQQSGENLFYYFNSDKNTKVHKSFMKQLKYNNLTYEQSLNANAISIYDEIAQKMASSNGIISNNYTFEEPQQNFSTAANDTANFVNQTTLRGYVTQIPQGTKISAYLQNAINTSSANKGDQIIAVLTQGLMYNNIEIAPQGSLLIGTLTKANHASYGSRNGRVIISFNQLVTPENKVFSISAEDIDFSVTNEGKIANSAKSALGSAAAGAIVGLLFGLLSGSDHAWRNAAIGAGVGAGSSVVISTAERGVDAEIPSMTEIEVTLVKPLSVSVSY